MSVTATNPAIPPVVSYVVATRDRVAKARESLSRVRAHHAPSDNGLSHEVIVVDDDSSTRDADAFVAEGLADRLVRTCRGVGVEAFNIGAAHARGRYLVVLDDDAWPDEGAVARSVEALESDDRLGAVALHPVHPATRESEWRPLGVLPESSDRWPLIGPGSVVRADAWRAVGGHERAYFLYGNDTDLALKLLGSGWGVRMRPGLVVWHDSPTASRRPRRWFRLAVRNRVWTMRRHSAGASLPLHCAGAWLEAHLRAGWDPSRHWLALRGLAEGVCRRPPPLPPGVGRGVDGVRSLSDLRRGRGERRAGRANAPTQPSAARAARIGSVTVVIPSHGRADDVARLLEDLARLRHGPPSFRVVVVDNASEPPLATLPIPGSLDVRVLRLAENTGGSGGFSAGLRAALGDRCDAVWLLDSDVRVGRRSLGALVEALGDRPGLVAAGSAMRDPVTGRVYEIGGQVDRATGHYRPAATGRAPPGVLIDAEYLAATSMLVRSDAAARTGLFPEAFLNGDDVEWTIRLARECSGRLVGVGASIVSHPMGQSPTRARYYQSFNAFRPGAAAGVGLRARLVRAAIEAARVFAVALYGRLDLAHLHLRGLQDARRGRRPARPGDLECASPAAFATIGPETLPSGWTHGGVSVHPRLRLPASALAELAEGLERCGLAEAGAAVRDHRPAELRPPAVRDFLRALGRLALGAPRRAVIAPFDEHPSVWACGRGVLLAHPAGFEVPDRGWRRGLPSAGLLALRALWLGGATALRRRRLLPLPPATPLEVGSAAEDDQTVELVEGRVAGVD